MFYMTDVTVITRFKHYCNNIKTRSLYFIMDLVYQTVELLTLQDS